MTSRIMTLSITALWLFPLVACSRTWIGKDEPDRSLKSLTGAQFSGKKYYIGWGAAGEGDPQNMHNEVRYDVLHTHNIFTAGLGGQYEGAKLIDGTGDSQSVKGAWEGVRAKMTPNDMYVQYSSGHGFQQGLGIGLMYAEIADYVLSLPGKELVVFMMACHSGGLVNEFESRKSRWQDFAAQGKTLLVMTSSSVDELSKTGPGTDAAEQGPAGSAGSAFGHALWKTLSGHGDGYLDGVKDGFLSLGEIAAFTSDRTKEIGGHLPVYTGAYHSSLIMNASSGGTSPLGSSNQGRKSSFGAGTDELSDDEIRARVRRLDDSLDARSKQGPSLKLEDNSQQAPTTQAIFVAIGGQPGPQDMLLLASGNEATQAMIACPQSTQGECRAGQAGSIPFTPAGSAGIRKLFKATGPLSFTATTRLVFVASGSDPSASGTRTIELRLKTPGASGADSVTTGGVQGSSARIRDLAFTVPAGWALTQDVVNANVNLFLFTGNGETFTIYAAPAGQGSLKVFAGGAGVNIIQDIRTEQKGAKQWQVMDTSKAPNSQAREFQGKTYQVSSFWGEFGGVSYYGYGRSERAGAAKPIVDSFLNSVQ